MARAGGDRAVKSMTAFSRVQGEHDGGNYVWELRSVNHRYLEPQFKLPDPFKFLQPQLQQRLRDCIARGKLECSLHFKPNVAEQSLRLQREVVDSLSRAQAQLIEWQPATQPLTAYEMLQWPGVLAQGEQDVSAIGESLLRDFSTALQQLNTARRSEGERLQQMIIERLAQIAVLTDEVAAQMPDILSQHQRRVEERLATLAVELDRDRMLQEVVLVAQKADIAEELDRLGAHLVEVRETLAKGLPCGRRLDFLMQELNREANTLGSKSMATETTQTAVTLKVLIEQMREQVQNIE